MFFYYFYFLEGITEWELGLIGVEAMTKEVARTFGDRTEIRDFWVWLQSGINTDGAHNPLTTNKIKSGDILSLNCFPMVQAYYTALERTMFLHSATDANLKYWEENVAIHEKGIELIKPGARY